MKKMVPVLLILLLGGLLLAHPEETSGAVQEGLRLCAWTVVPSLFPFLVVTSLLLQLGLDSFLRPVFAPVMKPLFGMRGECAAPLLSGFLGGYPAGAKAAAQLYEQGALDRSEAERLLGFCNNCGPGFMIGFVGAGVLDSAALGGVLMLIHMVSALAGGAILCRLGETKKTPALPCRLPAEAIPFPKALTLSVSGAVQSMLSICAYVVLFRAVTALLPDWLPAIVPGALEMVSGVSAGGFIAAAGITAWGGVSVHCQTMSVAGDLSLKWHFWGKLLQAGIAAGLAALLAPLVMQR